MSTIEKILSEKPRKAQRKSTGRRWKLRCLRNTLSRREAEDIMRQAELEEAMSRYEHGQEVA